MNGPGSPNGVVQPELMADQLAHDYTPGFAGMPRKLG
jgi:hypothetical protein